MDLSDLPGELVERGVWWQIAGFAIVSAASTAALVEFQGSETRAYQYLDTACKTMYWANVFVLVGLFEGGAKDVRESVGVAGQIPGAGGTQGKGAGS